MSGIVNKAKAAIHDMTAPKDHSHNTTTGTASTTSGVPAGTGLTTGTHGTTTHGTTTAGTHGSTNAGPHSSNMANKIDPRVDSDLDGGRHAGMNQTTHPTTGHATTTGTHSAGVGSTTSGSTNAGPYSSNIMNKIDPRVDSDLDGGRHAGMNQTTHPATGHASTVGHSSTTGTGVTGTHGTHSSTTHGSTTYGSNTHGSTNAGPHNSSLMNKIDPRVDSDLDGGRHAGMNQTTHPTTGHASTTGHTSTTGTTGYGRTGTTAGSTNAGPHNSNLMNTMDPRVDSDLDGGRHAGMNQTTHPATGHASTTGTTAGTTGVAGTTSGSTTAGPHKSNLLNKLDPRVDSDLDGSSNAGMNKTTHTTY